MEQNVGTDVHKYIPVTYQLNLLAGQYEVSHWEVGKELDISKILFSMDQSLFEEGASQHHTIPWDPYQPNVAGHILIMPMEIICLPAQCEPEHGYSGTELALKGSTSELAGVPE